MTLSPDTAFLKGAPQPLVVVRPQPTADVFELYRRVTKPGRPSLLLDSANAAGPVARYSFICSEPYLTLTGRGAEYTIQSEGQQQRGIGSAVEVLQELLHDSAIARPPGLPRFMAAQLAISATTLSVPSNPFPRWLSTICGCRTSTWSCSIWWQPSITGPACST